jgi:hypothetical protein
MRISKHDSKVHARGLLALGGAVGAGLAGGWILRFGEAQWPAWLVFAALVGAIAVAIAATIPWWRALDPMQKEAQLTSWYWGGIGGASIVLMALIASAGVNSDLARGALYLFVGQGGAFALYWLAWSLAHRGTEA